MISAYQVFLSMRSYALGFNRFIDMCEQGLLAC